MRNFLIAMMFAARSNISLLAVLQGVLSEVNGLKPLSVSHASNRLVSSVVKEVIRIFQTSSNGGFH
jgi:hypothetical protein